MESHDAGIIRLAKTARERGVRVFKDVATGQWFATSTSNPDTLHRVSGFSCDCLGFVAHQRCSHHSALLAKLGWLPVVEDAPSVACTFCRGRGEVQVEGDWSASACGACGGRGHFWDVVTDRIGPVVDNVVNFPALDRPDHAA